MSTLRELVFQHPKSTALVVVASVMTAFIVAVCVHDERVLIVGYVFTIVLLARVIHTPARSVAEPGKGELY